MANITIIPVLSDNYAYLLEAENGCVAIVDPGEAGPVQEFLERKGLRLDYILNTHHHGDHTGGNAALKSAYGAKLAGPAKETGRIAGMDILLSEDSDFSLGPEPVTILETPGHTRGGLTYYLPKTGAAFTGDTLFSMGCGKLFEGTAGQMWHSLQKIMALPEDTKLYPGHEYSLANAEFCLSEEPDNNDLRARLREVKAARAQSLPTIPVSLALEKKTNSFLRAGSAEKFAHLRARKDLF